MSDFLMKNYPGVSAHRLDEKNSDWNSAEVAFALAWMQQNSLGHTLEYLLGNDNQRGLVSERDIEVAATVIQWLGSAVGSSFLREVIHGCPRLMDSIR